MSNSVYYKLYVRPDGFVVVVCMQDFDEHDYDPSRFLHDKNGIPYRYDAELVASIELNRMIKPERISPIFRKFDQTEYFK